MPGNKDAMPLKDTLLAVREYYVSRFQNVLDEYLSDKKYSRVYSESALLDSKGERFFAEGVLPTPSRADCFLQKKNGDFVRVMIDTESQLNFKPIKTFWKMGRKRPVPVVCRSFQWNAAMFYVTFGKRVINDWEALRVWFMRWFKEDDPGPGELLGGVHFISDPEYTDNVVDIMVDFGTAPVESFAEFLDTLVSLGADTIEVAD